MKVGKLVTANKNLNEELQVVKTALQGRIQRDHDIMRSSGSAASADIDRLATFNTKCSGACEEEKTALRMQLDAAHQTLQKYADEQVITDVLYIHICSITCKVLHYSCIATSLVIRLG